MRVSPEYLKLKNLLKSGIYEGRFGSKQKIPSRKSLMRKYGFARGTVDRAVAELIAEGMLRSQRGIGTFVVEQLPRKSSRHGTVYVVLHHETRMDDTIISPFLHVLHDNIGNGFKLKIIAIQDIAINTEKYLKDASAFIFCQLSIMYYDIVLNLKKRNYPILLMNREDANFDFVTTDRYLAYKKALKDYSGGVGAILRQVELNAPYLNEGRAGMFCEIAMNDQLTIKPEWIMKMPRPFGDRECVKKIMHMLKNGHPRLLIVDGFLITYVLTMIHAADIEIGKDINLLLFEPLEIPEAREGIILLHQDYRKLGECALEWLRGIGNKKRYQKKVLPIIEK